MTDSFLRRTNSDPTIQEEKKRKPWAAHSATQSPHWLLGLGVLHNGYNPIGFGRGNVVVVAVV